MSDSGQSADHRRDLRFGSGGSYASCSCGWRMYMPATEAEAIRLWEQHVADAGQGDGS